jgi:catalase
MALTFELSKVRGRPSSASGWSAHLMNIDEGLASTVADKLGIETMPEPADAAVATRQDLPVSAALSIIENGPESFAGRKVGVLVSDGCDGKLLAALKAAVEKEGAMMELVAPKIGGIVTADGTRMPAHHMVDGGPSVLFDAVALVLSKDGAAKLAGEAAARDFVADAFAHCKFIGYTAAAGPLLKKAGVAPDADEGMLALDGASAVAGFVERCRTLRLWAREKAVKL